jgi:inward rectifier potassium channel
MNDRPRTFRERVTIVGLERGRWRDLYHQLLTCSWWTLLGWLTGLYLATNAVFASLYMLEPGAILNARGFLDAFFFSVQTMGTIGYGHMMPTTVYANALVTVEALVGMLSMAMAAGLMFAKFSRPTARVMFSNRLTVHLRDGVPSLVVRLANERGNQIVEAQCRMVLLRSELTKEGEKLRRQIDLHLVRSQTAVFALSWTVVHHITHDSPLHGLTPEQVAGSDIEVAVSLVGTDETFASTVHARYSYFSDEIMFGQRFSDVLARQPDGRVTLDFARFHDLEPAALPPAN